VCGWLWLHGVSETRGAEERKLTVYATVRGSQCLLGFSETRGAEERKLTVYATVRATVRELAGAKETAVRDGRKCQLAVLRIFSPASHLDGTLQLTQPEFLAKFLIWGTAGGFIESLGLGQSAT